MKLECYKTYETGPEIVPARSRRQWMDAFVDRHPYRCLPLTMANSTGWEILCPIDLEIKWNGGELEDAISFRSSAGDAHFASFASSHFRRGIVTMHTGHLFRTEPGWGVWCTAAPNWPKDGISPLTGLVKPELRYLDQNPGLKKAYETWRDNRADFNTRLENLDDEAVRSGWQRHYMRGQTAEGKAAEADHKTKRKMKAPKPVFLKK